MAKKRLSEYYAMLSKAARNLSRAMEMLAQVDDEHELREVHENAVVKCFEIAYELLIKCMLKAAKRLPEPEPNTPSIELEDAHKLGWVESHRLWLALGIGKATQAAYNRWRSARNQTAHTYRDEAYASLVGPLLPNFIHELNVVVDTLKQMLPDGE